MNESENSGDDIVDGVKRLNETAARGPISALLTPSFTLLGERLAEYTQRVVGRKRDNIAAHLEAVEDHNPNARLDDDPKQYSDLHDWAESASNHGDDEELSPMWRGILEEILTSGQSQKKLIALAKKIDHAELEDLRLLKNIPLVYRMSERYNSLVEIKAITITKGIRKPLSLLILIIFFYLASISWYFRSSNYNIFLLILGIYDIEANITLFINLIPSILLTSISVIAAIYLLSSVKSFLSMMIFEYRVHLSPEAEKLIELFERYEKLRPE